MTTSSISPITSVKIMQRDASSPTNNTRPSTLKQSSSPSPTSRTTILSSTSNSSEISESTSAGSLSLSNANGSVINNSACIDDEEAIKTKEFEYEQYRLRLFGEEVEGSGESSEIAMEFRVKQNNTAEDEDLSNEIEFKQAQDRTEFSGASVHPKTHEVLARMKIDSSSRPPHGGLETIDRELYSRRQPMQYTYPNPMMMHPNANNYMVTGSQPMMYVPMMQNGMMYTPSIPMHPNMHMNMNGQYRYYYPPTVGMQTYSDGRSATDSRSQSYYGNHKMNNHYRSSHSDGYLPSKSYHHTNQSNRTYQHHNHNQNDNHSSTNSSNHNQPNQ